MADVDPAQLARFEPFYQHYCPEDLESLPVVLTSFKGREDELWGRLTKKYGEWPPPGGVPEPEPQTPAPVANPTSEPAAVSRQASRRTLQPEPGAEQPAAVSRQPSARSAAAMTRQGTVRSGAPAAEAAAEEQAQQLSRAGTAARLSRAGTQRSLAAAGAEGGTAPALSRKSTRQSLKEAAEQLQEEIEVALGLDGGESAAAADPVPAVSVRASVEQPPLEPPPVEVTRSAALDGAVAAELDALQSRVADMEAALRAREDEAGRYRDEAETLRARNAELQRQADRAVTRTGSGMGAAELANLREQLSRKGSECDQAADRAKQAEAALRAEQQRTAALERKVMDLPDESQLRQTENVLNQARDQIAALQRDRIEREALVTSLRGQLERAQAAIIHATQTGFEHDVKLHQARSTLCSLMKKEKAKREKGSASPQRYTASPGQFTSPVTDYPDMGSPSPAVGYRDHRMRGEAPRPNVSPVRPHYASNLY
eukprot:TRINITY_DN2633_c3_g1_i1.p1 TRINITY_DN2633_c3_g1~~TRINITY_DN2633_c3_g1_i1.p1  ORF type:complete len:518 (+),score=190.15 TRINITY_DN2633_c3_g1_i1:97-1554(+)